MGVKEDIHIRKSGKAGRITLTRPEALNAMTYEMCMAIAAALDEWLNDDNIKLVIIDAKGERSFCAGGDISDLYRTGKARNYEYGRNFWRDEYHVNAQIRNYPKPYVAIMDGIVMGGGVGISAHGSHRIVTENTLFAMPECGIGLIPDVGGNLYLSRAPGHIGEYLCATGTRLKAADTIFAGIADSFVPHNKLGELLEALEDTGDLSFLDTFESTAQTGSLEADFKKINNHFSKQDAVAIVHSLEAIGREWEWEQAKLMRRGCPLSVACAVEVVRQARELQTIEQVLQLEYRFTYRSMSHGEFIEGIRAQIIDKDRSPNWQRARLEDLTSDDIATMLAMLGENRLSFK